MGKAKRKKKPRKPKPARGIWEKVLDFLISVIGSVAATLIANQIQKWFN